MPEGPEAGTAGGEIRSPSLAVYYLHPHSACNLACPYCVQSWKPETGQGRFPAMRKILERIQALPRPVMLIFTQWGEFFTSRPMMKETARMCNAPGNLVGVSVLTNLQADWGKTIQPFVEDLDARRLAIGATLHDRVISAADVNRFFDKVQRLREAGARIYVNYILHGAENISRARACKKRCDDAGVPLTLMPLYPPKSSSGSPEKTGLIGLLAEWSPQELEEIRPLCDSPHTYKMYFDARTPLKMRCGAGRDYIYVDGRGDVYPCSQAFPTPLGNILRDEIPLQAEDSRCPKIFCCNPYEASALRIVDQRYVRDRDFRLLRPRKEWTEQELLSGYGMEIRLIKRHLIS